MFSISEIKKMNANEAKRLVAIAKERRSASSESLVRYAHGKIESAAKKGETFIVNPFVGLRMPVSVEAAAKATQKLRQQGFSVTFDEEIGVTVCW